MVVKLIKVQDSASQDSPVISLRGVPKSLYAVPSSWSKILHLANSRRLYIALSPRHRKAHSLVSAHMKINCTGYEYKKRN